MLLVKAASTCPGAKDGFSDGLASFVLREYKLVGPQSLGFRSREKQPVVCHGLVCWSSLTCHEG